ncbi:OTULIN isoform 2, partial [Pan troglodytes]
AMSQAVGLPPWLQDPELMLVEMFLLAYAVRHTIQVYRLSKYNTEEFITVYPTDPPKDWPVVTLIAEDDRHYNIPVRVCEETSL